MLNSYKNRRDLGLHSYHAKLGSRISENYWL